MTEATQNMTINDVPDEVKANVDHIVEKLSLTLQGERIDTSLTALVCLTSAVMANPGFTPEQRKAGALFMLSMASKMTVDAGVSDTEIMSAMVQPGFYGEQQNAEAQPN
jgi:hypothetical protein